MSENDMFTIEDAENDGKIKQEVGPDMVRVAARQNQELFEMFENVCQDKGMDPQQVLSDGILRAIKNPDFAERISMIDVDMASVKKGDLRVEDAKLLREFSEQLGIDVEDNDSWLEDTVRERLQAKTASPLDGLGGRGRDAKPSENGEVSEQMGVLTEKIDQLEQRLEEGGEKIEDTGGKERKNVDSLFDDGDDSEPGSTDIETDSVVDDVDDREEDVDEAEATGSEGEEDTGIHIDMGGEGVEVESGEVDEDVTVEELDGEEDAIDDSAMDDIGDDMLVGSEGGEEDEEE